MRVFSKENEIFSLAKQSRLLPNVFFTLLIFILITIIGDLFLLPLGFINKLPISTRSLFVQATSFAVKLLLPFGSTIIAFFLWVKIIEKRSIQSMGFTKGNIFNKYLRGFIIGILMMASSVLLMALLGMIEFESGNSSTQGISALGGIFIVLIGWIVQGASEEIMLRGWMMPVIGARHNVPLSIFISSSLFGALHLANNNVTVLSVINLVLFGMFAAFYVIWEGSLWGICALHSAWNWTQGNLFGLEVSGMNTSGGILLNLKTKGPDIITGGLFGPEGGLIETLLLSTGIVILIILIQRKNICKSIMEYTENGEG